MCHTRPGHSRRLRRGALGATRCAGARRRRQVRGARPCHRRHRHAARVGGSGASVSHPQRGSPPLLGQLKLAFRRCLLIWDPALEVLEDFPCDGLKRFVDSSADRGDGLEGRCVVGVEPLLELFNGNSLAEAYYRTKPFNSWQLVLIGDPLYRPFKITL